MAKRTERGSAGAWLFRFITTFDVAGVAFPDPSRQKRVVDYLSHNEDRRHARRWSLTGITSRERRNTGPAVSFGPLRLRRGLEGDGNDP